MTADAVGGVWQYATDLSAELCGSGHRVTLALLGPPPSDDQRRQADRIAGLRLVETGEPLDWLCAGPEPVERAAQAIASLARLHRVDLIHCNTPALAGAAAFDAPLLAAAHGCPATWWHTAKGKPLKRSFRWHRELMRRGLAAASAVVAPSAGYAAMIQRIYSLPTRPRIVHNGRRPLKPAPAGDRRLDAALTVGRLWDEAKNAALLDRVAGMIEVPFLAAGSLQGPHGERVSLARMQVLGQLNEAALARLLARRPIFASAARFEPFGLAVLEAAMAGSPLVLSDIPTFRELWDGAAIFVDPADSAGFAAAIELLLADPHRRQALGEAAARRSMRYTPAASAGTMVRIYDDLLDRRKAAA